jgi:peptide/nickel transport system permease protein
MLEHSPEVASPADVPPSRPPNDVLVDAKVKSRRSARLGVGGWLAVIWLAIVVVGSFVVPLFIHSPQDPTVLADVGIFKIWAHPLGGDLVGNDMLLQLAKGARSSLLVALGAVSVGVVVGGSLGLVAGYYRGRADTILSSVFNILLAVPQFVLAVALVSFLANDTIHQNGLPAPVGSGRRLGVLVLALGIVSIPILARITRANSLQWSQREFVMAARAQGSNDLRIMIREVLPNVLPAMFSIALLGIAVAMVAEGGLSILGVGVHVPAVSWGSLIAGARSNLRDYPHIVFEPVVCLFLTVLSLNYLGDVVRARFDVRESAL